MKYPQATMSPVDVIILLKLALYRHRHFSQIVLADELFISQSEVSKSLNRSRYARLVIGDYQIMLEALLEFIQHGLKYVFPQQPGPIVRGVPTAHSMTPLNDIIQSSDDFVWPSGTGSMRGQAVVPLFPSVIKAAQRDPVYHEILALVDAIRVGKSRERQLAVEYLRNRLLDESNVNEEYPNQSPGYSRGR